MEHETAARQLQANQLPGRVIPATRALSARTARELLTLVVESNLAAMHA